MSDINNSAKTGSTTVPNGVKKRPLEKWEIGLSAEQSLIFDNVCHYPQESAFTKFSDNLQLDGFKNFIFLILLISCGRLMFENLSMYGFAANPVRVLTYILEYGATKMTLVYAIALFAFTMASLVLEKCYLSYLAANQQMARHQNGTSTFQVTPKMERNFTFAYLGLIFSMLAFPLILNRLNPINPFVMSLVCLLYAATFLKLYSYHQTNSWWRTGRMYGQPLEMMRNAKRLEEKMEQYMEDLKAESDQGRVIFYPQNLTISNMVYYSLAPTLCYQVNFPRTKCINWYFVTRCLLESVFLLELQIVLAEQWIFVPLYSNPFTLNQLTLSEFILRWTKMSLGTISIWLIGFYGLFQAQNNLLSELLRFADRDFYRDWWNAKSISEFWRNWNMPVHRFCVRHVFKPLLIEGGFSTTTASTIVFFLSGLFHEYLISPALGMFCIHFIIGMTLQQPLDMATSNIYKTSARLANSIVWLSLILGQSALLLQYYNDIIVRLRVDAAEQVVGLMI